MSNRSTLFETILDQVGEDYAAAEVVNRWLPEEDGDYPGVITKYSESVVTDDSGTNALRPRLTIQLVAPHDPELHGKELIISMTTKALFSIKSNVAVLAGRVVNGIRPSLDILASSVGAGVNVNVSTSRPKKGSTTVYRNANITQLLQTHPEEIEAGEDSGGAPAEETLFPSLVPNV
jgi:hypothetical protein